MEITWLAGKFQVIRLSSDPSVFVVEVLDGIEFFTINSRI
jgi:hypothetical protein